MVKVKNKKRVSVDQIHKKRDAKLTKKVLNPFEVHINKEKMRVLGKKQKNDKGLPGVSRAKALQKRKHTLLNEYKMLNKSNKFIDKRIGERGNLPPEDKIMARYAAIRSKSHNRKSIFNLADDEVLTHKGQTLSEIEKFDDPRSEDEDDEDHQNKTGKLNAGFVEDAHFGGGILTNTRQEGAKTHKQLIEQLIEESKKRKAEKQLTKEATMELTEKLDGEWKDLMQIVKSSNKNQEEEEVKPKPDEYDKLMRELKFERRGTVSDRLKTEDEIAKEEKEKLEKLEQDRLERMNGFTEDKVKKATHRSADDLDDDFVYESEAEQDMLTYDNEGQANVEIKAQINGKDVGEVVDETVDNDENSSEKEESDEEESDSDDSLEDLKADDSNDETDVEETVGETRKLETESPKIKKPKTTQIDRNAAGNAESEKKELEKVGNELPFTFKLPTSYDDFLETIKDKSNLHQKIILERMIKCNHPSLSQNNKSGLGLLFAYILQYVNDLFGDVPDGATLKEHFNTLSVLMPQIFELAQLNKENTHNCMMEVIKEKHQEFRARKRKYPDLEVLIYFKLVSVLFSTSDFRHQVVTPCLVFMEQILTSCKVRGAQDVAYGLFVCTLVSEYTALSNRYLPAVINFLNGILHMAVPKTTPKLRKVSPPFNPIASDLVLTKKCNIWKGTDKLNVSTLVDTEYNVDFQISALLLTLRLIKNFSETLRNLPSNVEIFQGITTVLKELPIENYPDCLKTVYNATCDSLKQMQSERKLQYLMLNEAKPKALRLYEPKIVAVYDGKRRKVQSKIKAEREKLIHKLKKETKGAVREIRRDREFLGRVKIGQKIQSDKERRDKVKKIYAEASIQQSELNALDRKNKKRK